MLGVTCDRCEKGPCNLDPGEKCNEWMKEETINEKPQDVEMVPEGYPGRL